MRNVLLSLFLLGSVVTSTFSLSASDLPSSFDIKKQTCKEGGCFDLTAEGQKIGALRRTPGTKSAFDFFDKDNERQIILEFDKFGWVPFKGFTRELSLYDSNRVLVAKLLMNFELGSKKLTRFVISSPDQKTVLATGVSNFFGTKHYVYVGKSWRTMATVSRPLFTWSRDSNVMITSKPQLLSTLDPNVLATVLVAYCFHNMDLKSEPKRLTGLPRFGLELRSKLQKLRMEYEEFGVVTEAQLKAAADLLNQRYRERYDDTHLSEEEKINQFVNFACDLIQSHTLQPKEEQAMLQFLQRRLNVI
ncbi:MAG: hypothetical protein NXI01_07120 [Gammaproteobacteria bacterium]|nr:hypothetical protein [Gammaproteobacteria bacterium]